MKGNKNNLSSKADNRILDLFITVVSIRSTLIIYKKIHTYNQKIFLNNKITITPIHIFEQPI